MSGGKLHQPAFALGPAVEELPDADSLLEAALPWIAGLCFIAAIVLASWDGGGCEADDPAAPSAAAPTLAPILASGRPAAAPNDGRAVANSLAQGEARGIGGCRRRAHLAEG